MKRTLGEAETGSCINCNIPFPKKRYDQKCCSPLCRQEYQRTVRTPWAERPDRNKLNAKRNARYYANHEQEKTRNREWNKKNPEAARQKKREYYQNNKEAHKKKCEIYRKAHPENRTREYRKARERRPWNLPLANARHRSLKKGFAFDLTREWCEKTWTGFCAVTNLPFNFGNQKHYPFSPSIDRIDSSLGYLQTNCRFVLFAVNSLKGTGTDPQMLQIARAIVQNCGPPIL